MMVSQTPIETPPGGRPRIRIPNRPARCAGILLFCLVAPAMAGDLEDYLQEELQGWRGTLRIDIMQPDFKPDLQSFGDILAEVPIGTWVTETGEVHHISPDLESGIRDRKTALLKGDRVRIIDVASSRRSTEMTLALASNPDIRARLEMRFSGSLRKDLSDIVRVWTALGNVLEYSPAPGAGEGCRKEAGEPGGPDRPGEPAPGEPDGGFPPGVGWFGVRSPTG